MPGPCIVYDEHPASCTTSDPLFVSLRIRGELGDFLNPFEFFDHDLVWCEPAKTEVGTRRRRVISGVHVFTGQFPNESVGPLSFLTNFLQLSSVFRMGWSTRAIAGRQP
jgi:hypothetical protein